MTSIFTKLLKTLYAGIKNSNTPEETPERQQFKSCLAINLQFVQLSAASREQNNSKLLIDMFHSNHNKNCEFEKL